MLRFVRACASTLLKRWKGHAISFTLGCVAIHVYAIYTVLSYPSSEIYRPGNAIYALMNDNGDLLLFSKNNYGGGEIALQRAHHWFLDSLGSVRGDKLTVNWRWIDDAHAQIAVHSDSNDYIYSKRTAAGSIHIDYSISKDLPPDSKPGD